MMQVSLALHTIRCIGPEYSGIQYVHIGSIYYLKASLISKALFILIRHHLVTCLQHFDHESRCSQLFHWITMEEITILHFRVIVQLRAVLNQNATVQKVLLGLLLSICFSPHFRGAESTPDITVLASKVPFHWQVSYSRIE